MKGKAKPVFASRAATETAARAGVPGCVEERVREGILAGRKRRQLPGLPRLAAGAYVPLAAADGAAVAVLQRTPRRLRAAGTAWLVVRVLPPERLPRPIFTAPLMAEEEAK